MILMFPYFFYKVNSLLAVLFEIMAIIPLKIKNTTTIIQSRVEHLVSPIILGFLELPLIIDKRMTEIKQQIMTIYLLHCL